MAAVWFATNLIKLDFCLPSFVFALCSW